MWYNLDMYQRCSTFRNKCTSYNRFLTSKKAPTHSNADDPTPRVSWRICVGNHWPIVPSLPNSRVLFLVPRHTLRKCGVLTNGNYHLKSNIDPDFAYPVESTHLHTYIPPVVGIRILSQRKYLSGLDRYNTRVTSIWEIMFWITSAKYHTCMYSHELCAE